MCFIRIGVTFNSPWVDDSPAALYDVLKEATTFETGKITAQLILNQNGDQILVEKESSLLHIPDHDSELKVYVTNDELDQDGCFHSKLPRRLAQWIMSDPGIPSFTAPLPAMVHAIQSVLGVSRRSLPTVLDEHGILDIDLEDDFEEVVPPLGGTLTAHPSPPSSGESVDTPQSTDGTDFVDLEGDTYLSPNIDQDLSQPASRQCRSSQASSVSALDRRTVPFEPAVGVSGTMANAYRRLLVRVVENSRHATVPLFNSATDEEPSIYNDPFNLRLYQKVERDQRVGAAGELWVSTMLPCRVEFTDRCYRCMSCSTDSIQVYQAFPCRIGVVRFVGLLVVILTIAIFSPVTGQNRVILFTKMTVGSLQTCSSSTATWKHQCLTNHLSSTTSRLKRLPPSATQLFI